ncbi:MAG TPA: hypothetical protein VHC69_11660 [Polyangiaceae bacterium]|nr:hypothetical protein [Polyangiaceae bacterium]
MRRRRCLGASASATALLLASGARAANPDEFRAERDEANIMHGMAELGVGYLTLPGAQVCIERQVGCAKGDSSFTLSAWPMFRIGNFSAGAGVMLGVTSSTNAPTNEPPDITRDHSRRYFSLEAAGRYFIPFAQHFDGFVGMTTGLVVLNDFFLVQEALSGYALVGPRAAELLTEGFSIGATAGLHYEVTEQWVIGAWGRYSNWFLPDNPVHSPFGDEASLKGRVTAIDVTLTAAFRSRLVF